MTSITFKRLFVIPLAVAAIAGAVLLTGCAQGEEIEITLLQTTPVQQIAQVYVGGGVCNPGYYPLKNGDDIEDLIQAAGGLSEDAELDGVELLVAQPGEQDAVQKIDINRAPEWLLQALPGIGEVKAQAITSYRRQNGLFANIDELLKVEGIGQSTLDYIRDFITVAD